MALFEYECLKRENVIETVIRVYALNKPLTKKPIILDSYIHFGKFYSNESTRILIEREVQLTLMKNPGFSHLRFL